MTTPGATDDAAVRADVVAAEQHQSVGDLISEVAGDMTRLVRKELELAKAELTEEAGRAGRAVRMLTGASIAALLVVVLLSFAAVYALAEVVPPGLAALIVAAFWAVVGMALYGSGRRRLREFSPVPRRTVQSLKEDMEWLRNPTG